MGQVLKIAQMDKSGCVGVCTVVSSEEDYYRRKALSLLNEFHRLKTIYVY